MVDDNRFSGLGDQLGDADEDTEPADTNTDVESETKTMSTPETQAREDESDGAAKDTPAFAFDAAKQTPIYPRESTLQDFEDALDFEVRRELRDAGHTDIAKRELHEALLLHAMEHTNELAAKVREMRGDTDVV